MHFTYRNVDEAYGKLMNSWEDIFTLNEDSRNGPVHVCPDLLAITYQRPWERVVTDPIRDCNPFFHFIESIWMLAGRNTVSPLDYFNKNIANYSDDGITFNGAYGYRWRHAIKSNAEDVPNKGYRQSFVDRMDQIQEIIGHLRSSINSRRAVLQMWNVEDDLLKVDTSKDVCCNLSAVFQIHHDTLHMTVYNRSNDVIWGMLGANAVHFSYLQEHVASALGVQMGPYTQVSCNAHIYQSHVDKYLSTEPTCWEQAGWDALERYTWEHQTDYEWCISAIETLIQHPNDNVLRTNTAIPTVFYDIVAPMFLAYRHHKNRNYTRAVEHCDLINDQQWRIACRDWIARRCGWWQRNTTLLPNTEGVQP